LQKCVTRLEAFDPLKARKRAPAVIELEAVIDKALSSAFGYGTPAYLRYNQAATLDPDPLVTNATLRSPVLRPIGGLQRGDATAHEVSRNFSENKERSLALLHRRAVHRPHRDGGEHGGTLAPSIPHHERPILRRMTQTVQMNRQHLWCSI
jgi:hypothetical protein